MSEEQISQPSASSSPLAGSLNTGNAKEKRSRARAARARAALEQRSSASPRSLWPFTLAVTLMFMLLGLMIHPILFAIGAVLAAVSVIGWALERR